MFRAILLLSLVVAATTAPAFESWQLLGGPFDYVNGVNLSGDLLFATTEEGYLYYDFDTGTWTDRTWPGWIGRARYRVIAGRTEGRHVGGGVNAWFKGTISVSDDMGANDELVHESTGGRVTDMDWPLYNGHTIYACTWSDIVDGELLRSDDDGNTWTPLTGHGHHAMTGVEAVSDSELYIAGDNYVVQSLDSGATWTSLQFDLPVGQGIYSIETDVAWGVPDLYGKTQQAVDLMAANDSGVWDFDFDTESWELVLPHACRAIDQRRRYITFGNRPLETYVVTFDGRVFGCLHRDWSSWVDLTAGLGTGIPLDVAAGIRGVFVTTDAGEVYSLGEPFDTAVPAAPTPLRLTAAPSPFNPATELRFELPEAGHARVRIFDVRGALVDEIVDGDLAAGPHALTWRPVGLASGSYRAVLETATSRAVRPIVLLK